MRRTTLVRILPLCASILFCFDSRTLAAPPAEAETQVDALTARWTALFRDYSEAYRQAENQAERDQIKRERYPAVAKEADSLRDQFAALAKEHVAEPAGLKAAMLLVMQTDHGWQRDAALRILTEHHPNSPQMEKVVRKLIHGEWPLEERLLRAVLEKNSHRPVLAMSHYALAKTLLGQRELLKLLEWNPKAKANLEKSEGRDNVAALLERNPERLKEDAERLFEQVIAEFGDHPLSPQTTLLEAAEKELAALRNQFPELGRQAKEIEGIDLKGQPLRLSDFRGKVVVLDFWATWCGPCLAKMSELNDLSERYRERPVVVLGVSADSDEEVLEKAIKEYDITWRNWVDPWDEEQSEVGPITKSYGVNDWPTLYVIDANGVIRFKNVYMKELNSAVETLLDEIDSERRAEP